MVCPVCVTSAIVASLPTISVSVTGVVAAKVIHKSIQKQMTSQPNTNTIPKKGVYVIAPVIKSHDDNDQPSQ